MLVTSIVPPDLAGLPALLDVRAVAAMLDCSPRHVHRMSDAGRMPSPGRVGAFVRWPHSLLEKWIADGRSRC